MTCLAQESGEVAQFDIYEPSDHSIETSSGLYQNYHLGRTKRYLENGLGVRFMAMYSHKTFSIGLIGGVSRNENKRDYPDNTFQFEQRIFMNVGFVWGATYSKFKYLFSYEYTGQDYRPNLDGWRFDLSGNSYGAHLVFPVHLGSYITQNIYGRLYNSISIGFFADLKYNNFDLVEASGFMMNIGFSLRTQGFFMKKVPHPYL